MPTRFSDIAYMDRHTKQLQVAFGSRTDYDMEQQKRDFQMEMEYRKLDQLTADLEKELADIRRLKAEMEDYKIKFNIEVKDNATKEINKLLSNLSKDININL